MEAENTKVVQAAYAAFLRRDIPALLNLLADDCDWHAVLGTGKQVPFSGARHGRDAVATFFSQVAEAEEFDVFEPRQFVAQGDTVVTLGHYHARTRNTGKTFGSDFAMVFTVRNGKIAKFREFTDSAGINAAFAH